MTQVCQWKRTHPKGEKRRHDCTNKQTKQKNREKEFGTRSLKIVTINEKIQINNNNTQQFQMETRNKLGNIIEEDREVIERGREKERREERGQLQVRRGKQLSSFFYFLYSESTPFFLFKAQKKEEKKKEQKMARQPEGKKAI